jgi:sigma-B regulation protein RsbU (phosphoserine phosphatase)
VTLGRSPNNDIQIPDSYCSNTHAILIRESDRFFVQDNHSKNGVYVNSRKIQMKTELNAGDEMLIGSTQIRFKKKFQTQIEFTDEFSTASKIDTILPVSDILNDSELGTAGPTRFRDHIIGRVAKALMLNAEMPQLLEHIMDLMNRSIPMDRAVLLLQEGEPSRLVEKVSRVKNKISSRPKIQVSQSIISRAIDQQSSLLISNVSTDPKVGTQDSVIRLNIQSAMCVPLWNNERIIGIVYADRTSPVNHFTGKDLRLLTLLSNLAAVKIEQVKQYQQLLEKTRMEQELEIAALIQKRLLPTQSPKWGEGEIAGINIPCHQVSGDYYDYIDIDRDRLGIVVADVSGKGAGPALYMAGLRSYLYAQIHSEYDIERMLAQLNDFIYKDTKPNDFISFIFCELNKQNGVLKYINAGHNPPIIINKKKEILRMDSCGFCLGMFPSVRYQANTLVLEPGAIALLFTDGIIEGRNHKKEEFSEQRLIEFIRKNTGLSAAKLRETICAEVKDFVSDAEQEDDMTLVIIKRSIDGRS